MHNPTQTGFNKGVDWIKTEGIDLEDSVSLSIDGDVFVLKSNGEILKFAKGEEIEFTTKIDPALENPNDVWTYNDVNKIYVFEQTNKRIIAPSPQVMMSRNDKLNMLTALRFMVGCIQTCN